jgi:hypothetical protein
VSPGSFLLWLSLIVQHFQEGLVVLLFVLVHSQIAVTKFLILHLSVQETGILVVDALDFILEAFFFLFVNFAVLSPHHGLLVVENLLGALTGLLLLHL